MKKTLAALALAAIATLPSTGSAQTIQACYVVKTGTVYRINVADAPNTCGKNVAFSWSATGPAGQTGPTGPEGPAGPATTYYLASTSSAVTASTVSYNGGLPCDSGDTAMSGGYHIETDDPSLRVISSKPSASATQESGGWTFKVHNPNAATFKISFHVLCAVTSTP